MSAPVLPQCTASHERPGIAATHEHPGVTALHEFDRPNHRRIFLLLEGHERLVVHGDDLGGVKNTQTRSELQADLTKQGLKHGLIAHQCDGPEVRILALREADAGDDFSRAEVAAHGVYRDATGCSGRHIHRVGGAGVKREA